MSKPTDDPTPVSSYLQRPPRLLEQALFDTAKDRGRLALQSWCRVVYVNIIQGHAQRASGGPTLFFDDFQSMNVASLAATEYGTHGYRRSRPAKHRAPARAPERAGAHRRAAHGRSQWLTKSICAPRAARPTSL
jgi:hypothetical protein